MDNEEDTPPPSPSSRTVQTTDSKLPDSEPLPSSSNSAASGTRARKSAAKTNKNIQQKILEIAQKEYNRFGEFLDAAKETDQKIINLMEKSNELLEKMINKM